MIDRSETPPPIEIRPCLAELFRTCVYPASLPLRIEKVLVEACNHNHKDESAENEASSEDENKKAYRLFLSDGALVVQALLQNRLIPFISPEHIVVGNTIVLKKFKIKRAKRLNGLGEVVFLGIADCDIVPIEQQMLRAETKKRRAVSEHLGRDSEEVDMARKRVKLNASPTESSCEVSRRRRGGSNSSPQDSDADDFETTTFDRGTLDRRRRALHELNINRSLGSQKETNVKTATINAVNTGRQPARSDTTHKYTSTSATKTPEQHNPTPNHTHRGPTSQLTRYPQPQPQQPPSLPTTSSNPNPTTYQQTPPPSTPTPFQPLLSPPPPPALPIADPPYHTLSSLLNPPKPHPSINPPKTSFPVTLFTIPSWLSPSLLHPRPNSPFPPKRHLKLHDPSISSRVSGVTLAVYCDAANFKPRLGVPVLVRGVVVQRLYNSGNSGGGGGSVNVGGSGEVILNAYEKLMRTEGVGGEMGRWFEDDEGVLEGLGWDVKGLRGWWEGRERERRGRGK